MKWGLLILWALTGIGAESASLRINILDRSGQPMPARVHLSDSSGKPQRAAKLPFWRDHFVCEGRAEIDLPDGNYIWQIERGPEFSAASGNVRVEGSTSTNITVTLTRLTDLAREGWWCGELHVHRPVDEVPLLMRAEDLHLAHVITWWNQSNTWKDKPAPARVLTQFDGTRLLHLMGGEDERGGGALLYFNLPAPLAITGSKREFPSAVKFLRDARKQQGVHVDIEKPFWWDTPLWLATGIDTVGIAHNHMHRAGVLGNEAWGRPRDEAKFPGPQGNGRYTQDIYYHILNCGLRVPPSAGSASGVLPNPVGYNRVYVHCDGELTWDKWHEGLRAGRSFVSNGPLLRSRANEKLPGHVFRAKGPLELRFDIKLDSRDPIAAVELVHNRQIKPLDHNKPVTINESGWFLVRAVADLTNTFRFASTAPWYVELEGRPFAPRRDSAQFFIDWSRERIKTLEGVKNLTDSERTEVLAPWREAEKFWSEKLSVAAR